MIRPRKASRACTGRPTGADASALPKAEGRGTVARSRSSPDAGGSGRKPRGLQGAGSPAHAPAGEDGPAACGSDGSSCAGNKSRRAAAAASRAPAACCRRSYSHSKGQPREYCTGIVSYRPTFTRSKRGTGVAVMSGSAASRYMGAGQPGSRSRRKGGRIGSASSRTKWSTPWICSCKEKRFSFLPPKRHAASVHPFLCGCHSPDPRPAVHPAGVPSTAAGSSP